MITDESFRAVKYTDALKRNDTTEAWQYMLSVRIGVSVLSLCQADSVKIAQRV